MSRPPLHLVTMREELPQYYEAQKPPEFPPAVVELGDMLHDAGHVEMAHELLTMYTKYERYIDYCVLLLSAHDGERPAPPTGVA